MAIDRNIGGAGTGTGRGTSNHVVTIETIAALRTFSGAEKGIIIQGKSTAGDGDGDNYYWDSSSVETDDGKTVIQVTGVDSGRWKLTSWSMPYVVDNAAAARAEIPLSGRSLHILSNDGKGGLWQAKVGAAAGTYTDNGGTYCGTEIIPTGGDGSSAWERSVTGSIYANWFFDEDAAEHTAGYLVALNVAQGKAVKFKPGTYVVDTVSPSYSVSMLLDDGVTIQHKANATDHMIKISSGNSIKILGGTLDGNSSNNTGYTLSTIYTSAANNAVLLGTTFKNHVFAALNFSSITGRVDINLCKFLEAKEHGANANETTYDIRGGASLVSAHWSIQHCSFSNVSAPSGNDRTPGGISIQAAATFKSSNISHNTFKYRGCDFTGNPVGAIDLYENVHNTHVMFNTFELCGGNAIKHQDSEFCIISFNIIKEPWNGTVNAAIQWQPIVHDPVVRDVSIIQGNEIEWSTGAAIFADGDASPNDFEDLSILDNIIAACTTAISVTYSKDDLVIRGNMIKNASVSGGGAVYLANCTGSIEINGGYIKDSPSSSHILATIGMNGVDLRIVGVDFKNSGTTIGVQVDGVESLTATSNHFDAVPSTDIRARNCVDVLITANNAPTTKAGAHDGANNASVLTDSSESWTVNSLINRSINNNTDGSTGIITANTATTITVSLAGGTDNDWDTSDTFTIDGGSISASGNVNELLTGNLGM